MCFVIDTTGSMHDDIVEARKVVRDIIDSKKGTQDEPSEYILVPFNDPGTTLTLTPQRSGSLFVLVLGTGSSSEGGNVSF